MDVKCNICDKVMRHPYYKHQGAPLLFSLCVGCADNMGIDWRRETQTEEQISMAQYAQKMEELLFSIGTN